MPERALGLTQPISEIKAELFRALANPAHVHALRDPRRGRTLVSELQPLVGIESSHLSQQLGLLRRARSRHDAEGRFVGDLHDS